MRLFIVILCVVVYSDLVYGQDLFCYQCLDGEIPRFCNQTANTQRCTGDQDTCVTTVTNNGMFLTSKKGCVSTGECESLILNNDDVCNEGVVRTFCAYCCTDNLCNYDRFPSYSVTTGPPTQPTTTTPVIRTTTHPDQATTTSIATVTPPEGCSMEMLEPCIDEYSDIVMNALYHPSKKFASFCRKIPDVFACLAGKLHTCCQGDESSDALDALIGPVTQSMRRVCPTDCNTVAGLTCVVDVQERILQIILNFPNAMCTLLQREIVTVYHCTALSVSSCDEPTYKTFNHTVSMIGDAIDGICRKLPDVTTALPTTVIQPQPTKPATTTETPDCDVDKALKCIAETGHAIVTATAGDGDFDVICTVTLPEAIACANDHTAGCSVEIKDRVTLAIDYLYELLDGRCTPTTPPPTCDTTAARMCIVQLWEVADGGDEAVICDLIETTEECVRQNTELCTDTEKESLKKALDNVLDMIDVTCDEVIKCPEGPIIIKEGGDGVWFKFEFTQFPSINCKGVGCKIYIDVVPDTTTGPKCKNGATMTQFVCIGTGDGNYCTREVTSANWQDVFRFGLTATIDFKIDGDIKTSAYLILRRVVNGVEVDRSTLCEIPVFVEDSDLPDFNGWIINDPHVQTFDGLKYNNYYEGVFTMYKHTHLPYQVQVAFERCSDVATCTCAVAIQSGDTVLMVNQCKARKSSCRGRRCKNLSDMRLFYHEEITDGTRIFRRKNPNVLDVLLPHGTLVRVSFTRGLNVYIQASPYDIQSVKGLLGNLNGDTSDDLMLPNGDIVRVNPKHLKLNFPRSFCKAWALTRDEYIFYGVPRDTFKPTRTCAITPAAGTGDGISADCGAHVILETCNLNTKGEITYKLPNTKGAHNSRRKRATDAGEYTGEFDYEFDVTYEPSDEYSASTWTEAAAQDFCRQYLVDEPQISQLCLQVAGFNPEAEVEFCVQDILASDGTDWFQASMEAIKEQCRTIIERDTQYSNTPAGTQIADQFNMLDCLNECSGHGTCVNGTCQCYQNYIGVDCSAAKNTKITDIFVDTDTCNSRNANCRSIVIYGDGFIDNSDLTCHLLSTKINNDGDVKFATSEVNVAADFVTQNQIICEIPGNITALAGYKVTVSNDGSTKSDDVEYLTYDDACFVCSGYVPSAYCSKQSTSCIIDHKYCYRDGDTNPEDPCQVCNPDSDVFTWSKSKASQCKGSLPRSTIIIIILVILLLVTVFLAVFICMICKRKSKNNKGLNSATSSQGESTPPTTHTTTLYVKQNETIPLSNS